MHKCMSAARGRGFIMAACVRGAEVAEVAPACRAVSRAHIAVVHIIVQDEDLRVARNPVSAARWP